MTPSFKEIAILWKDQKRQYVKPSTYSTYVQLCNSYIIPAFGSDSLPEEPAVQAFANGLLSRGFAVKTVKDTVLVLKMIIRQVDNHTILKHPYNILIYSHLLRFYKKWHLLLKISHYRK